MRFKIAAIFFISILAFISWSDTVWLDTLDVSKIATGWGQPRINKSVGGTPINIGDEEFERGLGLHAESCVRIRLDGRATSFHAMVGVDQVMRGKGSVEFAVIGDGKLLWRSGTMRGGMSAHSVDVSLSNVKVLDLISLDCGDGNGQDHADWAMVRIETSGAKPYLEQVQAVPVLPRPVSPTNRSEARAELIPYPRECAWGAGTLYLDEFSLDADEKLLRGIVAPLRNLRREIESAGGQYSSARAAAELKIVSAGVSAELNPSEAYGIAVRNGLVELRAVSASGARNGLQTLRQLVQTDPQGRAYLPECKIRDWPAFARRGFMHDVGRNFQDIELLKNFVDLMARYKLNIFHFHLTDYPGYRIESRAYPQLNDPENYRSTRRPGEHYSFDELNDFIAYCAQRGIQVVPEIDIPGHSAYFDDAFGFDMQDPRGLKIVLELFEEFMDNVDVPVMHIGSDEVHVRNPEFMPAVVSKLRERGKDIIVWRPGHFPDRKVVTQLWSGRGRPVPGVRFLDSRANYINHMDALVGPIRAFMQQPCRRPIGDELALGAILCHWPDSNVGEEMNIYRQSPVLPAMLAFSERAWRGALNNRGDSWAGLPARKDPAFEDYAEFEHDMLAHGEKLAEQWPFPYTKQTHIPWKLIGPFDHHGDTARVFPVEDSIAKNYEVDGKIYRWTKTDHIGGTIHVNHFFGFRAHLPKSQPGTVYGLTHVKSPRDQKVDFWIGFNGQSRAGIRASGPNPEQGEWSVVDSQVWVNGDRVDPPVWKQPGLGVNSREIPLIDENYYFREPTSLQLRKGWNTVLVKAPHGKPARKWMFTFAPAPGEGAELEFSDEFRMDMER